MSDRIAVMSDGHVLQVGSPSDIYEQPLSRFVAGFIGSCNVFDARTTMSGAEITGVGPIPVTLIGDIPAGTEIAVAVRPERIRITTAPHLPDALAGNVSETVYTGDEWRFGVQLGENTRVVASVPTVDLDPELVNLAPGTPVWVSWRAEHARGLAS